MIKVSLITALLLIPVNIAFAEPIETTEAFYAEKPIVYVSPEDRVNTLVFTVNSNPVSDNVSIKTVKRDKINDNVHFYESKYIYCIVQKDIKSIYAESMIKKTCISEYGEGSEKLVSDTKLDLTKAKYLEYPIPAGKRLEYFSLQPVEMGKPMLNYIDLLPGEKKVAYLIYGFTPANGEVKQGIIYVLK